MCQPLRERAFDALVSNPPYLTEAEYRDLDPSVGEWEPELALVSGTDGMSATGGCWTKAVIFSPLGDGWRSRSTVLAPQPRRPTPPPWDGKT